MIKTLIILYLIIFHLFAIAQDEAKSLFSLSKYNEKEMIIDSILFPRMGHHLFRAMGRSQFGVKDGIKAMFGHKESRVESKVFTHLKMLLSGKKSPFNKIYVPQRIQNRLSQLKLHNKTFDSSTASRLVLEIINDFYQEQSDIKNIKTLIDYRSSSYINWNNIAVFSALSPLTCYKYKKEILISFVEKHSRSIDLNYWNYINNRIWSKNNFDIGEYITPSHIEADSIMAIFETRFSKIQIAFMKTSYKGEGYILGFIKPRSKCLILNSNDKKIYECLFKNTKKRNRHKKDAPIIASQKLRKPDFILRLCPLGKSCAIDDETFDYFETTGKNKLPIQYIKLINRIKINGQHIRVFYKKAMKNL